MTLEPVNSASDESMLGGLIGQISALEKLLAESKPRAPISRKPAKSAPRGYKYDRAPWVGEWIARGPKVKRSEQAYLFDRAKVDLVYRDKVLWAYARQAFSEVRKGSHPTDEQIEISFDDLFQEAMLGLIEAVSHYDYNGASFGAYSKFWIRQRIFQALNTQHLVHIPLNRIQDMRNAGKAIQKADQVLGRTASLVDLQVMCSVNGNLLHTLSSGPRGRRVVGVDEVAEQGMDTVWVDDVRNRMMVPRAPWGSVVFGWSAFRFSSSIDAGLARPIACDRVKKSVLRQDCIDWHDEHREDEWLDLKPSECAGLVRGHYEPRFTHRTAEDDYSDREFASLMQVWLSESLDAREFQIVTEYFGFNGSEESTLEEIGNRLGLTRERIRQLRNRAIGKIQRRFPKDEIRCHFNYLMEAREAALV